MTSSAKRQLSDHRIAGASRGGLREDDYREHDLATQYGHSSPKSVTELSRTSTVKG